MELDVDRVHDVLEGKIYGRGCGDTTATLTNVATAVFVGDDKRFVVVVDSNNLIDSNLRLFLELFRTIGGAWPVPSIVSRKRDEIIFSNGCRVRFISRSNLEYGIKGLTIDVIYLDEHTKCNLRKRDIESINVILNREIYVSEKE